VPGIRTLMIVTDGVGYSAKRADGSGIDVAVLLTFPIEGVGIIRCVPAPLGSRDSQPLKQYTIVEQAHHPHMIAPLPLSRTFSTNAKNPVTAACHLDSLHPSSRPRCPVQIEPLYPLRNSGAPKAARWNSRFPQIFEAELSRSLFFINFVPNAPPSYVGAVSIDLRPVYSHSAIRRTNSGSLSSPMNVQLSSSPMSLSGLTLRCLMRLFAYSMSR